MPEKGKASKKRIVDIILYSVMAVLFLVIGLAFYSKLTGRPIFSVNVLWVLSESMEPAIPEDSYVLVKKADVSKLKIGDVITFYSQDPVLEGRLNTHRISGIIGDNEGFITKGDNNLVDDSYPVLPEDIVSVYICNLPVMTFFGRIFQTGGGLIMTFIVIAALMVTWFYLEYMKKKIEKDKEDEIDRLVKEEVERMKQNDTNNGEK